MITTLIIIGVVAFIAVDAYIIHRLRSSHKGATDHGRLPVPGELNLMLPAGTLKLNYQESRRAGKVGGSIAFGVPSQLSVEVASANGEQLEVKAPRLGSTSTGKGWSRALIGTVEIPGTGHYTVRASADLPNAVEPQVLVGQ
jgi:hypothetical protein